MPYVYLNGRLLQPADAAVPALDRGLLHAFGLFETMRSYDGRVFRLEAHYRRLADGAAVLDLPVPLSLDALREAIDALLDRNALPDARIRLTLTAGPAPDIADAGPSVIITAVPLTDYPPELYRRGMSAVTSATRRNDASPLCRVKSLNHLENILAREEARRRGADAAILFNTRGLLAEGSHANVFLVHDGRLLTPGLDSGVLPGVTRAVVIELAPVAGLTCVEGDIEPKTLSAASEAFLTGSIMEIMPLTSLDGRPIGDGRPGPLTRAIHRLYQQAVARETAG